MHLAQNLHREQNDEGQLILIDDDDDDDDDDCVVGDRTFEIMTMMRVSGVK